MSSSAVLALASTLALAAPEAEAASPPSAEADGDAASETPSEAPAPALSDTASADAQDNAETPAADEAPPPCADEDPGPDLRPATRRLFLLVHPGLSLPIDRPEFTTVDEFNGRTPWHPAFQLEESLGVHLLDRGDGPFLALALSQQQNRIPASADDAGLPRNTWYVSAGLRFGVHIPLIRGSSLYLTPTTTFSYRHASDTGATKSACVEPIEYDAPSCEGLVAHQFVVQLGLGLELVVFDRLLVSLRPLNLDFIAPRLINRSAPATVSLRLQFLAGLGFSFG